MKKFKVYYIDDQAHLESIEANRSETAAWRFVQRHPRHDTSQITTESDRSTIHHYRACDLIDKPEPPDDPVPEFVWRGVWHAGPIGVLGGSFESLQNLANGLVRGLEKYSRTEGKSRTSYIHVQGITVDCAGSNFEAIAFEVDRNIEQYLLRPPKPLWNRVKPIVRLILLGFAFIGLWTVAKWISRAY